MTEFTIYPAIDLRGGRVVRLKQGRAEDETVYSDDPADAARRWQDQGAQWLHVVDLDRALGDELSPNTDALKNILAAINVPVQFGGGLRQLEQIQRAFHLGVARAVVGTVAVDHPEMVAQAVRRFGTERIAVAIDARNGRVATRGWVETSELDSVTFGKRMRELGLVRAIVTDIARDGMLDGVDVDAVAHFAQATDLRVIASGGVATLDDLLRLRIKFGEGVEGAIVGQALYQGRFPLKDALELMIRNS